MVELERSEEMIKFLKSGIYYFNESSSNLVFMDPVRVLNSSSYTQYRVSHYAYYSRFFGYEEREETRVSFCSKKRKRKQKKSYALNEREQSADQRHQVKFFVTIFLSDLGFLFSVITMKFIISGSEVIVVEGT